MLVGPYPGQNDRALARVRQIISELEWRENAYAKEKAAAVLENFELWLSERRWQRYCGGVPDAFRIRILTSISKLEGSLRD